MKDKIRDLIISGTYSIPKLLLSNYKELKINESELILLIYLLNEKNLEFNPAKISSDLNIELTSVMTSIDNLTKNNIISLSIIKENGIRKDVINLDNLYDKLLYLVINEDNKEKETDIYSTFETEFGRTLAPMEYEIISSWIDTGYSKELIVAALKEAVYNGVFKLNYIDKILFEWNKKGIKNPTDIEKNKVEFKNKKEEKKELYDYNWLEDE
ncbi:MAG: DnaD domain protein [Bacilli bacterium]|nr:DnaD domain protein [Bacilli bacterium]